MRLGFFKQGPLLPPELPFQENDLVGGDIPNKILYPVGHRQFVFGIPILLRIYLKYDRKLLTPLCQGKPRGLFPDGAGPR